MHSEWFSRWRLRLGALLRRRRLDRDLNEEIKFHLESRAESLKVQGVEPEEAARRAAHQFEGCLLAGIGGAAGLLLAGWGTRVLVASSPVPLPSFIQPALDLRVILVALLLTCGVALILGLAPGLQLRSLELQDVFKQTGRQATAGRERQSFRSFLVVAEVALALVLLVGAGLLIRSLHEVSSLRLGYDPSFLLTLRLDLPRLANPEAVPAPGRSDGRMAVTTRELLGRIQSLPGVETAAAGSDVPLGGASAIFYTAEGQPVVTAEDMPRAYVHRVTSDFFRTLRIPLLAGRTFTERELVGDSNVVIVSQSVVNRFWPDQEPLGKRIKAGKPDSDAPWLSIIGVVNDLRYRDLPENPTADPDLFFPFSERQRAIVLLMRTSQDPSSLVGSVRQALLEADPTVVIYGVAPLDSAVQRVTSGRRFTSWLMGVFAGLALLLSVIGIYGVMAYTVSRRTQEIGIRMALGAARLDVLRLVAGRGARLVTLGLALGIAGALAVTRLMESLLYGVPSQDPLTFGAAALILAAVAALACLVPALRAGRMAPVIALRDE